MIELETIFRSLISIKDEKGQETVSQGNLIRNFRAMQQCVPETPEDKSWSVLYGCIKDYVSSCDTRDRFEVPSYDYLVHWFNEEEPNEEVITKLQKVKTERPYIGQDFRKILRSYNDKINEDYLERILVDANKIAKTGMKQGKGKNAVMLRGVNSAIDYFFVKAKTLRQNITGIKVESQVLSKDDTEEEKKDYEKREHDPTEAIGVYTGLSEIDNTCNGLKNTEFLLVNAFSSQGKTTFSMYMAYRAINAGWNTGIFTLEQSFSEIRRQIYVKHTCNTKWEKEPKFAHLVGNISIEDVTNGTLTKEEKAFYYAAMEDLKGNDEYGRLFIKQPEKASTTTADIELKAMEWQQELQPKGRDIEFLVVDYITLLDLPREERSRDSRENTNNLIRKLKQICLTFNNGKGIRMLSPFQASRKGYEAAKTNEGVYDLTALSDFHEAERSADIVMSLYMSKEWREEGKVKISCQKNRRHKFFKPFFSKINFGSLFYYDGVDLDLDEEEAIEKLELPL